MPMENIEVDVKPTQLTQHEKSSLKSIDKRSIKEICVNICVGQEMAETISKGKSTLSGMPMK